MTIIERMIEKTVYKYNLFETTKNSFLVCFKKDDWNRKEHERFKD